MELKLKLHLIPQTSFYYNLRSYLGRTQWSKLSRRIREKHNYKCQYCGFVEDRINKKYTNLHEIWKFDEKNKIQKLIGFECICSDCHNIHHWGFSKFKGLNLEYLIKHACRVNNCTPQQFKKHIEKEKEIWYRRSQIKWKIELGDWKNF